MLPINISKHIAVRCTGRAILTQARKESTIPRAEFATNSSNSSKKTLALASVCTLTGIAIGISCSESKEPGIFSNAKVVCGLYLQKLGKTLEKQKQISPPQTETTKELEKTKDPTPSKNSPTLLNTVYNSLSAQAVGYGALGTVLAFMGLPIAAFPFGLMGAKILESSGGYDYLMNQTFAALGIPDDAKNKKT